MSKSDDANPKAEPASDAMPRWENPLTDKRTRFKVDQRAWRHREQVRLFAELAAGAKQYQVALCPSGGSPSFIKCIDKDVRQVTVGASSPDEAIGKFCRFARITGGMENVKIVG